MTAAAPVSRERAPRMRVRARRWIAACAGAACALLALPQAADAHGIVGKADLPIPVWLFSWAAAVVLVVSFVALSTLWTTPQLQVQRLRRAFPVPAALSILASVIGLGFFALVIYSGFAGAQVANANFSVTFIYVAFWVGVPLASVLAGDVFRVLSPWRSFARAMWWLAGIARRGRPQPTMSYPRRLGVWPAIAGLVGFAWLELIYAHRDVPSTLAALSAGYFAVMVRARRCSGWMSSSPARTGSGCTSTCWPVSPRSTTARAWPILRRPLSGITGLPIQAGTVTLICTMIGTTTFDGVSNGGYWKQLDARTRDVFNWTGLQTPAVELSYTLGLLACIALVAGILSPRRARHAGRERPVHLAAELTRLRPHARPDRLRLRAGPLLLAADLAGPGARVPDLRPARERLEPDRHERLGDQLQDHLLRGYLVRPGRRAAARHVGGLTLAHDRALAIYRDPEEAVRSQYWMLG